MNHRLAIGILLLILAVLALYFFLAPTTVGPEDQRLPDDVTGPGNEGAIATGGALETDAAGVHSATPSGTGKRPGL